LGFEVAASALLTQAEHGSRWISVVLFYLDHFKKINDVHGHDAGDAVLRHVAGVARENFRSFDLLVRQVGAFDKILEVPVGGFICPSGASETRRH
ncbi:GGDEF domain-containing protein, partial [Rhizobium johnstonii]|uniref:GGDEF domain-containing protein n=1 Tax=Rhizobium johnstonii TaxID=3019933 RepID=UPI003F97D7D0